MPFNNSYRPGKKPFDFYITQVSYSPQRAKAVDFSKAYYFVNQSVVGRKGKPIASVRSINGLKKYKLGAQIGTTSYDYIVNQIKPSSTAARLRHERRRGAGAQERPDRRARRRPADGVLRHGGAGAGRQGDRPVRREAGTKERFGLVLQKGNTLTPCVNKALDRLWANGTIKTLQRIWLAKATGAPVLK